MEEEKKTSRYLYEDEDVFLTEDNQLFLKKGQDENKRKLGEVQKENVEQKVAELQQAFAALKAEVEELLSGDSLSEDRLAQLVDKIKEARVIGDTGYLLDRIDRRKAIADQGHQAENVQAQEASDTSGNQAPGKNSAEEKEAAEKEAAEEEAAEEEAAEEETAEEETAEKDDPGEEDPVQYYREIVKKAEDLAKQSDWPYVSMELDNLSHQWSEGPDAESEQVKKLFQRFNNAVEKFEERREQHYEELNRQKKENLETKKKLLEEFEGIISNKTWTATKRVNQMKRQWNNIGSLPSGETEDLDERFEELLGIFNDHKVDRLVQQRQKEEDNLMLKLVVLEKMEKIAGSLSEDTSDWKEMDESFDDLTKQWKKIGRVPKEKSNHVWERYKNAQDQYYDRKYKFDKEHQKKVDKFYNKKEQICKEAEALSEADDLATAARKINKLHRRWKKVGNLPQRAEDELWGRFKSATDAFNEYKSSHQDLIQKQEEEHYQKKLELIDQAIALKDTDDFDKGHSRMQSLMDQWKEIGPVSRKKSNKIWKQFKGAMDEFYDRRREHFKEVKEERKENLKEKQDILEKLRELGQHEDPIEAVNIAKDLQEKFKSTGYVPIKKKNQMWKKYREACDVIYDRYRAAKSGDRFDQELAKADLDVDERNKIQKLRKEFKKVKKEVRELEEEVLQYKETRTYFKPTDGGNSLLDEIEEKIEKTEQKLEEKQLKLDSLTDQMEDIRSESED